MKYIHLRNGMTPPDLEGILPFRAVVIVEEIVDTDWQNQISKWLVSSRCFNMMAWGINCSEWDYSVDTANLEMFDYGEIPEENFVMTSWHKEESKSDVFWFCEHCVTHDKLDTFETVILDISETDRETEIMLEYQSAKVDDVETPLTLFTSWSAL